MWTWSIDPVRCGSVMLLVTAIIGGPGCSNQSSLSGGTETQAPAVEQTDPAARSGVDEQTQRALAEALADERRARSFYEAVLDRYGDVRPFSNIVHAERRHEGALIGVYQRYGLPVPPDDVTWKGEIPATLRACCTLAAEAERQNVAIYDAWLEVVSQEDIRRVFVNLQAASLERHLPAFERCSAGGGRGRGFGARRGQRP